MHTECLGLVCRECGKRIPEAECALSCPDCGAPMRVMFSEASFRQALSAGLPAPEGRSFPPPVAVHPADFRRVPH